ncbi:M3 family metallopeptidase [Thiolapillus sp.]
MRLFPKPSVFALLLAFSASHTAFASTPSAKSLTAYQEDAAKAGVIFDLPQWEKTPAQIQATTEIAISVGDGRLKAIAGRKPEQMTFANTIAALDYAYYPVSAASYRMSVIQETSPDKRLRDAALEATKTLQKWFIDASFRQDVYQAVKTVAAAKPALKGEDAMYFKTVLRDYRRNGMELPKAQREQLQALKNRLNNLQLEFQTNITEANALVEFTREELEGVSDDFLGNKEILGDDGLYRVNANVTWQVLEVLRNAKKEETRKRLTIARSSRAMKENTPLFTEILKTRAKIAKLLGYDNWADYRIETKMAKNGKTARDFLQNLSKGLAPKFEQELATLAGLKAAATGDDKATIHYWDIRYYRNQLKKSRYQIDTEKLKVFFELENTLSGMFSIFEELFDIKIEAVKAPYKWVDELRLYAVTDATSGAPLGLIYMDMFPREGKYNHFAQFGVTPGKLLPNGKYQRPVVALVCNFPPPANGKPSLLTYDHVETLFHEFGHALHSVLTQAGYLEFSGTGVPRDFVEAPSQMLENWVNNKQILDRFAVDYRDGKSKIPAETLDKMEAARLATIGAHYRRQLGFGLLDLALHMTTDEEVFDNFIAFTNKIMSDTYIQVPENTAFVASFGHIGGGYDAGYYGYAWADAISADMASVFRQAPGGLMDKTVGMRLRNEIYAVGGSREIDESIRSFLQREPSLEPFFEHIGLKKN